MRLDIVRDDAAAAAVMPQGWLDGNRPLSYGRDMVIAGKATAKPEQILLKEFAQGQIERWCEGCHRFLMWEKEHILRGNPLEQERNDHKATLKWLLRLSKVLHAMIADPDAADHSSARMLELTVWKLERSWSAIYDPMPDAEAARLLKETFSSEADQQLIRELFPE